MSWSTNWSFIQASVDRGDNLGSMTVDVNDPRRMITDQALQQFLYEETSDSKEALLNSYSKFLAQNASLAAYQEKNRGNLWPSYNDSATALTAYDPNQTGFLKAQRHTREATIAGAAGAQPPTFSRASLKGYAAARLAGNELSYASPQTGGTKRGRGRQLAKRQQRSHQYAHQKQRGYNKKTTLDRPPETETEPDNCVLKNINNVCLAW